MTVIFPILVLVGILAFGFGVCFGMNASADGAIEEPQPLWWLKDLAKARARKAVREAKQRLRELNK